jgi:hypothetical protein
MAISHRNLRMIPGIYLPAASLMQVIGCLFMRRAICRKHDRDRAGQWMPSADGWKRDQDRNADKCAGYAPDDAVAIPGMGTAAGCSPSWMLVGKRDDGVINVIAVKIAGDGAAEPGEGKADAVRQPIIGSGVGGHQSRWVATAAVRKARFFI